MNIRDCWLYLGSLDKKSNGYYGRYGFGKNRAWAHRISYETFKGKIPKGLTIDHLCRNTVCINPDHLEAVTTRENTLRGIGPSAINARKKHCPKGHLLPLSPNKQNRRSCRVCRNSQAMIYHWKHRPKVLKRLKKYNPKYYLKNRDRIIAQVHAYRERKKSLA